MNLTNILVLIALNFYCVYCTPYYLNFMDKRDQPKIYCGKRLTSMVALVCQNQFYSRDLRRPPQNEDFYNYDSDYLSDLDKDYKLDSDLFYPFSQKSSRLNLLPNKVRRTSGIVEECCLKACTVSEIQSYCA